MCCGSKRHDAMRVARPASPAQTARGWRELPAPASAASGNAAALSNGYAMGNAGVVFVHDGAGELVVTGSKTGRRYRFAGRGARLAVDATDAAALEALGKLRRL